MGGHGGAVRGRDFSWQRRGCGETLQEQQRQTVCPKPWGQCWETAEMGAVGLLLCLIPVQTPQSTTDTVQKVGSLG